MKRNTSQDNQQLNTQIMPWLQNIFNAQQIQIQQLGNGLVYCLIMNHYYPSLLPIKKICLLPKKHADFLNNMRAFNQVIGILKWTSFLHFDINKITGFVAKDNVYLLNRLYNVLSKNQTNFNKITNENHANSFGSNSRPNYMQKNIKSSINPFQMIKLQGKSSSYTEQNPKNQTVLNHHSSLNLNIGANLTGYNYNGNQNLSLNAQTSNLINPVMGSGNNTKISQGSIVDKIKQIVSEKEQTDRQKVCKLKNLLGIQVQQKIGYQQWQQKDLLNDQSKKQPIIQIDDDA